MRQSHAPVNSCITYTLGLPLAWLFLVLHLNDAVWQLEHSSSFITFLFFYIGLRVVYFNRMPHLSGPRRYFFHHSNRVLPLQNCSSLAGKTGGTRIDMYRALVMTLVRKCKEQYALAHLYNRLARRLFARRRCGSCSVFEVAQSVYKYAPNRLSDKLCLPQLLIIHY